MLHLLKTAFVVLSVYAVSIAGSRVARAPQVSPSLCTTTPVCPKYDAYGGACTQLSTGYPNAILCQCGLDTTGINTGGNNLCFYDETYGDLTPNSSDLCSPSAPCGASRRKRRAPRNQKRVEPVVAWDPDAMEATVVEDEMQPW